MMTTPFKVWTLISQKNQILALSWQKNSIPHLTNKFVLIWCIIFSQTGADDDDTIMKAFDAFEVNGKIDADMFKHSLMTFGDKFSASEVDNAFGEFVIEDGMIDAVHLKGEKKSN